MPFTDVIHAADSEGAAELYRSVVDEFPQESGVWLELSRIKLRQGDSDASIEVIDEDAWLALIDGL